MRYQQLYAEISALEKLLWESVRFPKQLNSTTWNIETLLARIDELDHELSMIERLQSDVEADTGQDGQTE